MVSKSPTPAIIAITRIHHSIALTALTFLPLAANPRKVGRACGQKGSGRERLDLE